MATSYLRCRATSAAAVRRRGLPFVGAFCVLSLGFSTALSFSSSLRTGCARSLPFVPLLRSGSTAGSKLGAPFRGLHSAKMEGAQGSGNTVPSIVVYVTVPSKEAGKKLAESIIKERLAACVNIVPGIESIYHWQGKIETDSEELLIIKTRESLLEPLTQHVKANHPYDVPEVIGLPIQGGNVQYLEWIKNSTRD
ncbi:protein CutA, chloroplastic isoform X1 [Eucalyptus grandis]|uniref:protein CutA, chloroplastic isoform X1 n=1 Tax=Eucalyptus grandis TaxID=71139 RepID=UPI00192F10FF|nr:protein CutA, chloroplastic isoform X1 [Eucalyptus grandis]